jgi:hypothetical protein
MVGIESLGSMANVMKEPILFYMYLFMGRMGKFTHLKFLGKKNMPSLIPKWDIPKGIIKNSRANIKKWYGMFEHL